jgi:hypothetical protein
MTLRVRRRASASPVRYFGVAIDEPPAGGGRSSMSTRRTAVGVSLIFVLGLVEVTAAGQAQRAGKRAPLRTAWGAPDLQGVWDFRTLTPLERPKQLAGKQVVTDAEAAAFERATLEAQNADRRDNAEKPAGLGSDIERAYNQFWYDWGNRVTEDRRTSLIVDPPDGLIPWTSEGRQRAEMFLEAFSGKSAAGPEDRLLAERCILGFNSGPPMVPSAYNNNMQVFQTRDHVVILNEMVHSARIIPLDGRPHLPRTLRQWVGDSRGRWEGDMLVVETTNFLRETGFRGSSANMRLVERFRRVDADTLLYEFTVEDSTTWTRPWTAVIPMRPLEGQMFEYACHEGNYGMTNLLAGARALEAEAARKK